MKPEARSQKPEARSQKPEALVMNERGSTTQNVIILSILVLIAILIALLLYRTVSDESTNIEQAAEEISDITLFSERECPQGQVRNTQTNECETDQTGIAECPQGQVRNLANECVADQTGIAECPQGEVRNLANECVADQTGIADCPQGQVRNTQTNECEQAAPCADNEIRNDEGQCVVGECPQGEVKNAQTNECEQAACADNEIRNAEGQCVVGTCPQGEVKNSASECVVESTDGGGDVDEPPTYWTGPIERIHAGDGYTCVVLGDYSSVDGLAYLDDDTHSEIRCWGYDIGIDGRFTEQVHSQQDPPSTWYGFRTVTTYYEDGDFIAKTLPIYGTKIVTTSIPKELPGLSGTAFKDFATSHGQFCTITASNAVICYGRNLLSQLGLKKALERRDLNSAYHWPEPEIGEFWKQTRDILHCLNLNPTSNCLPPTIDHFWTDSDVYYDGVARQGGVKGGIASETPVSLWTGNGITCAITASDKVFCWGAASVYENYFNSIWPDALADGSDEGSRFPLAPREETHLSMEIPELSGQGITQLAFGDEHMCALYPSSTTGGTDGTVKCQGSNNRSQLGTEYTELPGGGYTTSIRKSDTLVEPYDPENLLRNAKKIVAGAGYTCAITAINTVACWGYWDFSGSLIYQGVTQIPGANNVLDIVAHGGSNICWVTSTDIVSCIENPRYRTPLLENIHISEGVKSMSVGRRHICILTNANTIRCATLDKPILLGLEPDASFSPNTLYEVRIPYNGDS